MEYTQVANFGKSGLIAETVAPTLIRPAQLHTQIFTN